MQRQVVLQRIVRMEGLGALGTREAVLAVHLLVFQKLVLSMETFAAEVAVKDLAMLVASRMAEQVVETSE